MSNEITRRTFMNLGLGAAALAALGTGVAGAEEAGAPGVTVDENGYVTIGEIVLLPFTHYASGGVAADMNAVVLFENKNKTFTRYQVAYTSCTCRDAASNYRSIMYVELLNNKDTADEAKIRQVSFTDNDGYHAGVWGDSNPIHMQPDYTQEYMAENFVNLLWNLTKADIDAWGGYGTQIDAVDADMLTGATVSTSNIMSVLGSLFAYHAAKYYKA